MNIANLLSCIRLLLVPIFARVFFSGRDDAYTLAVVIFLIAGATDVLDGVIARRFNMITKLGRILDPLADKLMLFTVLVCTSVAGLIPYWITALYFLKELLQALGAVRLFRVARDMLPANNIGKLATFCFYVAIVTVILFGRSLPDAAVAGLFIPALALTFSAYVIYHRWAVAQYGKKDGKEAPPGDSAGHESGPQG